MLSDCDASVTADIIATAEPEKRDEKAHSSIIPSFCKTVPNPFLLIKCKNPVK